MCEAAAEIYCCEGDTYRQLQAVCLALFAPDILTPDRRRDLANRMHIFLLRFEKYQPEPEENG